ncbi:MAG: ABC transporter permease [Pseudomonadota bacterium]
MSIEDRLRFAFTALHGARMRTVLMLLAMAIGVAAVVLLTSLGEGARRYVVGQFSSLGTHMVIVFPGRNETTGNAPPMLNETPRDLTLDDALSLQRIHTIRHLAPVNIGSADIAYRNRDREAVIMGTTAAMQTIRELELTQGKFLPPMDAQRAAPVVVIGEVIRQELFGNQRALGEWVRIGDRRFRVIGVMTATGVSLGIDTDELVVIPVASAQQLFNTSTLFRIIIEARGRSAIEAAKEAVLERLRERHDGEEDVTVITQDALLTTFDRIFTALTFTIAGIGAISLIVAGILIMNIMLVTVTQRTTEIGLLKAIGASSNQVMSLFLTEAILLSFLGALLGLLLGQGGSWLLDKIYSDLQFGAPLWALIAALGVALTTGVIFGVMPARRAARLDPVQALARR